MAVVKPFQTWRLSDQVGRGQETTCLGVERMFVVKKID